MWADIWNDPFERAVVITFGSLGVISIGIIIYGYFFDKKVKRYNRKR